jgi:cell division transport system permease protein
MAAVLALAVGFIVAHLIRLQALTRRAEIEVSQLVGATAADVRRPLIYHGFMQGILSGAVALAFAGALAFWAGRHLQVLAPANATELKVVFFTPMECLAIILAAGLLGWIAAGIAAHREIRRFART